MARVATTMTMARVPVALMLVTVLAVAAWAQPVPVGSEFQVNTSTTGYPTGPSVVLGAGGEFLITWNDDPTGSDRDGWARLYDGAGAAVGAEFRVNTYTANDQGGFYVARGANDGFVVVWMDDAANARDGSMTGIFGQRFDSAGQTLGADFQVNTGTTSAQQIPRIASDPSGAFVVTWNDSFTGRLKARRFASSGSPLGAEFQVTTDSGQSGHAVARDPAGDFIVAWTSGTPTLGAGSDVKVKRFAADGPTSSQAKRKTR
jgi:hypothetical protein